MGVFSAITHREPNSLARAKRARDCNVGKRRLCFPSLRFGSVWFHLLPLTRSHRVKAYMCVCSCHECVMDPDSRGRWIYDYNELQQHWTRKYLSNCGKTGSCKLPTQSLSVLSEVLASGSTENSERDTWHWQDHLKCFPTHIAQHVPTTLCLHHSLSLSPSLADGFN